jgi:hypothetical protein
MYNQPGLRLEKIPANTLTQAAAKSITMDLIVGHVYWATALGLQHLPLAPKCSRGARTPRYATCPHADNPNLNRCHVNLCIHISMLGQHQVTTHPVAAHATLQPNNRIRKATPYTRMLASPPNEIHKNTRTGWRPQLRRDGRHGLHHTDASTETNCNPLHKPIASTNCNYVHLSATAVQPFTTTVPRHVRRLQSAFGTCCHHPEQSPLHAASAMEACDRAILWHVRIGYRPQEQLPCHATALLLRHVLRTPTQLPAVVRTPQRLHAVLRAPQSAPLGAPVAKLDRASKKVIPS